MRIKVTLLATHLGIAYPTLDRLVGYSARRRQVLQSLPRDLMPQPEVSREFVVAAHQHWRRGVFALLRGVHLVVAVGTEVEAHALPADWEMLSQLIGHKFNL